MFSVFRQTLTCIIVCHLCFSYFPEIFNASGIWPMVDKFGDWFTYDKTPRANIFRRDHHKVVNETTMMRLMR